MQKLIFRFSVLLSLMLPSFFVADQGAVDTKLCFAGQAEKEMAAPAGTVAGKLPDSGQTSCYNNIGKIPCPQPGEPFYGQDGNYSGNSISFTDNGDGTATDNVTGLTWQRQDDGVVRNWQEAVDYCENLSLAGYGDWRLPSKKEIVSIVDFGRNDPAIDTTVFPDTKRGWYWSATARAVDPFYAWGVFSSNGRMHGSHKMGGTYAGHGQVYGGLKANDYYARCVRSRK